MSDPVRDLVEKQLVGKSTNTVKTHLQWLKKFADWLQADDGDLFRLTRADVQQYIAHLSARRKKASTINVFVSVIRNWARWTGQEHAVESLRYPRAPEVTEIAPKSLDRRERNRLLRAVERDGNLRNIAIVYMLLYTGLRVSELCALTREDVEIRERSGRVLVRNAKNRSARIVPLPVEARHHLSRYLDSRADHDPALFVSQKGGALSPRQVQYILARYGVHPHVLRHTYIRTLVEKGIDIATVAELAGHRDINVTRRYAKPTLEEIEQSIEAAFVDG